MSQMDQYVKYLVLCIFVFKSNINMAIVAENYFHYVGEQCSPYDINEDFKYYWGEGVSTDLKHQSCQTPILSAKQVYSCGTAQADIRPVTYEDGSPFIEQNKLYYTTSSRTGGVGPIVLELELGTAQLRMTGCMKTYYSGKIWRGAAPHVMYNRFDKRWQVTIPVHIPSEHVLAVSHSYSDVRFGVTPLYFERLDYQYPTKGDEDGVIFFDGEKQIWCLAYASLRGANNERSSTYLLRIQESNKPDSGFKDRTGANLCDSVDATGITVTKVGGKRYVLSGDSRGEDGYNRYAVINYDDLCRIGYLNIDFPDKGFRGWNNVTPILQGDCTRYVLLTFDRGQSSRENNWTYGNLYLYYSKETNVGWEFPKYNDEQIDNENRNEYGPLDLHFMRYSSGRNMLNMSLLLSEINISAELFAKDAEVYGVFGDKVRQESRSVYSLGRESLLLGGIHQPFSNYLFPLSDIKEGEERYLRIWDIEKSKEVKISFLRDNRELKAIYSENGDIVGSFGTIRKEAQNANILFGDGKIFLYTD